MLCNKNRGYGMAGLIFFYHCRVFKIKDLVLTLLLPLQRLYLQNDSVSLWATNQHRLGNSPQ